MSENPSQCPVLSGANARGVVGTTANQHWWPNQLNLKILHQNPPQGNPPGEAFNYVEVFRQVDLEALKRDRETLMTNSQAWWPADTPSARLIARPIRRHMWAPSPKAPASKSRASVGTIPLAQATQGTPSPAVWKALGLRSIRTFEMITWKRGPARRPCSPGHPGQEAARSVSGPRQRSPRAPHATAIEMRRADNTCAFERSCYAH